MQRIECCIYNYDIMVTKQKIFKRSFFYFLNQSQVSSAANFGLQIHGTSRCVYAPISVSISCNCKVSLVEDYSPGDFTAEIWYYVGCKGIEVSPEGQEFFQG